MESLKPAADLVTYRKPVFPGESDAYRDARTALLAQEIELRRHMTRVAQQRQALPPEKSTICGKRLSAIRPPESPWLAAAHSGRRRSGFLYSPPGAR